MDFVGGRWPGLTYLTKITLKVHLRKHQAPFQGDNTTHLEDEKVSRCTEVQDAMWGKSILDDVKFGWGQT